MVYGVQVPELREANAVSRLFCDGRALPGAPLLRSLWDSRRVETDVRRIWEAC